MSGHLLRATVDTDTINTFRSHMTFATRWQTMSTHVHPCPPVSDHVRHRRYMTLSTTPININSPLTGYLYGSNSANRSKRTAWHLTPWQLAPKTPIPPPPAFVPVNPTSTMVKGISFCWATGSSLWTILYLDGHACPQARTLRQHIATR